MPKKKYEYWTTQEGLILLQGWARQGATDEVIADKCDVSVATLYRWKNDHPVICEALKKGKEVVDFAVENALLRNALNGDTTAQIFWLKNRKPEVWRDKRDIGVGGTINTNNPFAELTTEELKQLIAHD